MKMELLLEKFDHFAKQTDEYRKENDRVIRGQTHSINCLRDSFVVFKDQYGPMLEEAVTRRKWWAAFWERQKSDALDKGFKITLIGLIGVFFYGVAHKVQAWVSTLMKM